MFSSYSPASIYLWAGCQMSLELVEWAATWPLVLPCCEGRIPAGFPGPAEDYLESPLDLTEYLIHLLRPFDSAAMQIHHAHPCSRAHKREDRRSPRRGAPRRSAAYLLFGSSVRT